MSIQKVDNVRMQLAYALSLSIFKDLRPLEVQTLCDLHLSWMHKDKDTLLIRAGDKAPPLLMLTKGIAFKYYMLPSGGRQILSLYLPGDSIGLDVLLSGAPSYPVRSAGSVTFSTIGQEQAAQLANTATWFRDKALAALAQERAAAEMAIIRLGQCDAEQRVASILVDLYQRFAERGLASNHGFVLELTQQHLADMLGLTAVHLNRTIGRLRARGLLTWTGQHVQILDMGALDFLGVVRSNLAELAFAS